MIGDPDVGRTDVLSRFTEGKVTGMELGEDTKSRVIDVDGKKVRLTLTDPAGQERFRTVTSSFYRKAHGVVIVYDITDDTSFNNCQHWLGEVTTYAKKKVIKGLLGNKSHEVDKRLVQPDTAKKFSDDHGFDVFFEVSAQEGSNIDDAFIALTRKMIATFGSETSTVGAKPTTDTLPQSGLTMVGENGKSASKPASTRRCIV